MHEFDLAINHGIIINADHRIKANIGVRNGEIVEISRRLLSGQKTIDAAHNWVIPGVVDTHVHFALQQGQGKDAIRTEDDYVTGPQAAAVGGVTTFVDYAVCPRDRKLKDFLQERMALAAAGSCIDYSFHNGITNPHPDVIRQVKEVVGMGIPSFKFFTNYRKWGFAVDLGFLWDIFNTLRELNGAACIHCEQDDILEYLRAKHAHEDAMRLFAHTRPDFAEEIAISEVVTLAREAGSRLHIVHLTTEKGLRVIQNAQRAGVRLRTETCPHYLQYSDEVLDREDGYLFTMTPPLRPPGNSEALWQGLEDGSIGIITSDHNALGKQIKSKLRHWLDVPPGLGGSEMALTYTHSEGVAKSRITAERMVELLSTAPALQFGIPKKGRIAPGYDADLVIFNPDLQRVVKSEDLATPGGFTIYEGLEMQGWPLYTISRGDIIVEDRKFTGATGRGRFIARELDPAVW